MKRLLELGDEDEVRGEFYYSLQTYLSLTKANKYTSEFTGVKADETRPHLTHSYPDFKAQHFSGRGPVSGSVYIHEPGDLHT